MFSKAKYCVNSSCMKIDRILSEDLKKSNKSTLFRYIYDNKDGVTQKEIANALDMSLPTIRQNLLDLFESGILVNTGYENSSGGRKAQIYAVNQNCRFAIGAELSPSHIRLVALDIGMNAIAFDVIGGKYSTDSNYAKRLAYEIERFIDINNLDRKKLLGVGISLPAVIDEEMKLIVTAPVLKLKNASIENLTKDIPYDTFIQNDASAGAVYETWLNKDIVNLAYLFIGKGVGGAIIVDGKLVDGDRNRAGEFGHSTIDPNGKPCHCGRLGCLEAYCSTSVLSNDLGISLESFFFEVENGNEEYRNILDEYLKKLSIGIYNIHCILDFDVLIGGPIRNYLAPYLEDIKERVKKLSFIESEKEYISLGHGRYQANCNGVALHFISKFIDNI